jgi:hypothetical protein
MATMSEDYKLSIGAIRSMFDQDDDPIHQKPVLQVLSVKKVSPAAAANGPPVPDRFR